MKTLNEISGVATPQIDLENSTLVIIDAQREYLDGRLPLANVEEAIAALQGLLETARQKHRPVIHIAHEGTPGGLFDPKTKAFEIVPPLAPRPSEKVILKRLPDSFAGTELLGALQAFDTKNLILAGFMTHMCVLNTAVSALNLGFHTAVVKEAVATRDLRGPDGERIAAQVINNASLAAIQDRLGWVISVQSTNTCQNPKHGAL